MKKYVKPEMEITSYEAEQIMLVSGGTQASTAIEEISFNDLSF